jgi:thioredoxin reductase
VGDDGKLTGIRFTDGREVPCKAMFFKTENYQKSLLADKLGCNFTPTGLYETLKFESTNIPGLFVAGDASHSLHMVSIATASGTEAAFAINTQLLREQIKCLLNTSADPPLPPTP